MPYIVTENKPLHFFLRRSLRAKRLQMVLRQQAFEIIAPPRIANQEILAFVFKNQHWMMKQLTSKANSRSTEKLVWPDLFLTGESILYRGQALQLNVKFGSVSTTQRQANSLLVILPWQQIDCNQIAQRAKQQVIAWYKQQAAEIIQASIHYYCPKLGCWPKSFEVKQQKTRWGSCGIQQKIYLNWLLMLAPVGTLEYVVVHELCHLLHRNHGKRFWAKVAQCLPDYKQYERLLRQQGYMLQI